MNPLELTPEKAIEVIKAKGYPLFDNGSLNICGIRCTHSITDEWDDFMFDLWKEGDGWKIVVMRATTKPGRAVFNNLPVINKIRGTALLKEGNYPGMWYLREKGHYGHDALMQKTLDIDIHRIDSMNYNLETTILQNGKELNINNGIDNHSVWNCPEDYLYDKVANWGEGCQVIARQTKFKEHFERCKKDVQFFGNSFSYKLFNLKDFETIVTEMPLAKEEVKATPVVKAKTTKSNIA